MIRALVGDVGDLIHSDPWLAVAAVFLGGMLTASSPCVLVMVPLMVSFVGGRREAGLGTLRAFGYSLVFVLGLGITFTTMGFFAALAGRLYGEVPSFWSYLVAAVCGVMGLHLMGVLRFTIPVPIQVQPRVRGALGALLLGLLFGVVSAPCAAPILVVLLTYLAGSGASLGFGALLLMVYALGHSVLVLLAGTSMGLARRLVESRRWTRASELLRRAAGVFIVLVGAWFLLERLL